MTLQKRDHTHWAQVALTQYLVKEYTLCYLGHSDNLTFRVDEAGGAAYLLRLHEPVAPYYLGIRQQPEVIAGELAWLEALLGEGGFSVQRPVHTNQGESLGAVETEPGESVPVTLLTWLDGVHFMPALPGANGLIEQFGELVARLHEFSGRWSPPPGFLRPVYDVFHFRRLFARLLRGADLDIFSESVYRILRAAGQAVLAQIESLPADPAHWGLIHADLHVGNFLVREGQISPIDFSFCGVGHYLYDLSISLAGGLNSELRPRFLAGYRRWRPLPESDLRFVEAYAMASRLSYYASQVNIPAERDWLKTHIPRLAETVCQRFLREESILDSQ